MRFSRPDIADLAYFLVVARHLNFRRAALDIGISASAVSHSVRGLEGRLGIRLLNRTNRSVTLTAAGEELRDGIEGSFEHIGQTMEALNRHRSSPSGHIRLNVLASAAENILAPVLPTFIERYPEIVVEISLTNRMVDIVGQGFDAGIRFGGTVPDEMIAQRLSPEARWVVAGAPGYLDQHGVPLTPKDLLNHRCMQIRLGDEKLYQWEFEKNGQEVAIAVPGPVILDEGKIALNLAIQGAGLIYMTEWNVRKLVDEGALQTVLDDWSPVGGGFHIYYPGRRQVPTGVRLPSELVREMRPLG